MTDSEWAEDFSYAFYGRLLDAAAERFHVVPICEAPDSDASRPLLMLRHDIDLCPRRALVMAEFEAARGLRSTFHILMTSPFYSLSDPPTRDAVIELGKLGHEVGLHFDLVGDQPPREPTLEAIEDLIAAQATALSERVGTAVRSVSFHRPLARFIRGPERLAGLVNAYSARWMARYLSDSRGRWREGNPLDALLEGQQPVFQLLTHPIWWAQQHVSAPDRLQEFFSEGTATLDPDGKAAFDRALTGNISIPRAGLGA